MRGRPLPAAAAAALHGRLTTAGELTPYAVTHLLTLYAAAGDLRSSVRLFSLLPSPSLYAYTPLLSLLSRSNLPLHALSLYSHLRRSHLSPDPLLFTAVFPSCAAAPAAVPSIHCDAVKLGAAADVSVANAVVSAYAKAGDLESARRVFDGMPVRDVVSYNALMAGYAALGDAGTALHLMELMESDGCRPDGVTWNTVMAAYCGAGRCDDAARVLRQFAARNVVSWTTVIVGYARGGDHMKSVGLFREMVAEGCVALDAEILSCILSSCRHLSALKVGRSVHAYGIKNTDAVSFSQSANAALVTLYASSKNVSAAETVFRGMNQSDAITWNAMIAGFVDTGSQRLMLAYLREMIRNGVAGNDTTYATALSVCDVNLGKQIHCYAIRKQFVLSIFVSNALISMYARSGEIEAARQVFSRMQDKDVVSWNSIIGAYGSHGEWKQALGILHLMENSGMKPNSITITNLLVMCCCCGLVDEGIELFERLVLRGGATPTLEQCSCIVDMLSRAGRFREAVEFIGEMPMMPNARIWGAVLSASQMHQNVEFGRLAFEKLVQIEPENPGNFVTMSAIYMQAGRLEDAKRVRKAIETHGLVKPSGNSWMEALEK